MEHQSTKTKRKRQTCKPIVRAGRWNMSDKRKLLATLKQYPIDAYEDIASMLRDKDADQVKEYLLTVKERIKNKHKMKKINKEEIQRAPLEEWLEIASDMVDYENVDSSANLTKVMTVISNFEEFPTVNFAGYDGVDFKLIYKYMSQLLQANRQEDLIKLAPLESAIMVDMLHSLMEVLSQHDVTVQRNVMKWKYQLLEARDKFGHYFPEYLKRASENDFTEFIDEVRLSRERDLHFEKRYMHRKARKSQGEDTKEAIASSSTESASMPIVTPGASTSSDSSQTVTPGASTSGSSQTVTPGAATCGSSQTTEQEEEVEEEVDEEEEEEAEAERTIIKKHKPGRKGALDPPEIPRTEIYLVMPPKGVKIVNYNPRAKKTIRERHDGKYQALNQAEELINNDLSREITYDVHRAKLKQFEKKKPSAPASEEWKPRQIDEEDMEAKYAQVIRSSTEPAKDVPVKKPKLYSLNPFCLPVTLLDLGSN